MWVFLHFTNFQCEGNTKKKYPHQDGIYKNIIIKNRLKEGLVVKESTSLLKEGKIMRMENPLLPPTLSPSSSPHYMESVNR